MNPHSPTPVVLVIGYGNDLRGDDCAGRRAAQIIADRCDNRITVRSVHQLTPDLAPLIADADLVIFADASAEALAEDVRVRTLSPSSPFLGDVHSGSASELLGLANWLYGKFPQSYAVDIAADNFGFSDQPSPRTQTAIMNAVAQIDTLIANSGNLHA